MSSGIIQTVCQCIKSCIFCRYRRRRSGACGNFWAYRESAHHGPCSKCHGLCAWQSPRSCERSSQPLLLCSCSTKATCRSLVTLSGKKEGVGGYSKCWRIASGQQSHALPTLAKHNSRECLTKDGNANQTCHRLWHADHN